MLQTAKLKWIGLGAAIALAGGMGGCRSPYASLPPLPPNAIKPVVAVTEFDNQTGFAGQWKLGQGIPDLLVTELMATRRLTLVDRTNLGDVLGEITRQGQDWFRKEDSVKRGRLKNARYLIRGVITEFTQTGSSSAWFRSAKAAGGISGANALIMINLTVTDVETGEIICSVLADGSAKASGKWASFEYSGITFGGELFYKTPIGKATQEAIRKAVYQIIRDIPCATWKAQVADVAGEIVTINGGENVGVREGDEFDVREEGRAINDPGTGNTLEVIAGKVVARIRITEVRATAASAMVISGTVKRGYFLEKAPPGGSTPAKEKPPVKTRGHKM